MARFISAGKRTGFLKNLEIERKNKKNPYQDFKVHKDGINGKIINI
jgi:hypothetical protein